MGSAAPHLINAFGGVDWRGVVGVTSALTVAGGLLAELVGRDGPYASPRSPFDPRQARLVFGNRGVRLASLAFLGHMWELYAMWTWFAVFFGDVLTAHGHDRPVRGAALATFAVIAVGAVGCWAGGLISDRHGPARAATLAMACSAVAATVIGFARGLPVGVVLVIGLVWGFSVIADSAQLVALVTELADQSYVGTAVTMQLATGFSLTVLTIWLVPVVRDHSAWSWAFAVLAPGPLLGIVALRRLERSAAGPGR